MKPVAVLIRFTAKPGQRDALASHLRLLSDRTKHEPGTLMFLVHTCAAEPDAVYLYEAYHNESARTAHEHREGFAEIKGKISDLVAKPAEIMPLTPIGGKGIHFVGH